MAVFVGVNGELHESARDLIPEGKWLELREAAVEHLALLRDAEEDRTACGCLLADVAHLVVICAETGSEEFSDAYLAECYDRLTDEAETIHNEH